MAQLKTESICFNVKSGEVKTSLITPLDSSGNLAVVLPGASYSCKQPLLYFAIQVLLKKKFNVLAIEKVYGEDPKWTNLATLESALKVVEDDSIQLFAEISKKFSSGMHTVVGRSLGTYAMACALEHQILKAKQLVWQTPSLNGKWETIRGCGIRSFGIIGTSDERYEIARPHLPTESIIIEGADHGMEIPDDPIRSIEILKQVTSAMSEWLSRENQSDIDVSQLERNLNLAPERRLLEHQAALDLTNELASAGRRLREQSQ